MMIVSVIILALVFAGCVFADSTASSYQEDTAALTFDTAKWNYDTDNDVYWMISVPYCTEPQDTAYETMGIFVPGAYLTGTKNADGTYTCTPSSSTAVGNFTGATAPIVIPVNTPGYASSPAPTEYSYDQISAYLKAGFIYLQPGIRGRQGMMMGGDQTASTSTASGGAPWGVTDIKAAIRYYRFNKASLPGNSDAIFSFGMSGGGAQSALVGATGDSALYTPYLEAIGAAMTDADNNPISDAVYGSMCWCPITSLDYADEAYEWNMGQFANTDARADTSFTSAVSKDMAAAFADYINALQLKNGDTVLTLDKSDSGIYMAGTYYDFILSTIETSLNNFLSDTTFPYTETTQAQFPGGFNGTFGNNGDGAQPAGNMPDGAAAPAAGTDSTDTSTGTTYNTVQDYIDSLNSDTQWVTYDAATNTAKVSSVQAFVEHCKNATKSVGAFDEVDRGQGENKVFGDGADVAYHFDAVLAKLLADNTDTYAKYSDWQAAYVTDYQSDLQQTDSVGTSMQTRVDMYNPMYYLSSYYQGYQTSKPASYWRIRTGIDQSDTALTVESNLALALQNYSGVKDVDFATVWGMKHVEAERTGDNTTNFIAWVNDCMSK